MCRMFFLTIIKQRILLWILWLFFTDPWQFLIRGGIYWGAMSLINAVFYWHNITGINGPKAGGVYWSAVATTDPRCRLLIWWWQLLFRHVVYWYMVSFTNTAMVTITVSQCSLPIPGCQLLIRAKKENVQNIKTCPKKVQNQKSIFYTFM